MQSRLKTTADWPAHIRRTGGLLAHARAAILRHLHPPATGVMRPALSLLNLVVPKNPDLILLYGLTNTDDAVAALGHALLDRGQSPVRLLGQRSATPIAGVRDLVKSSPMGAIALLRAGTVLTTHALYGGIRSPRRQRMVLLWHGEVVKPTAMLDGERGVPADLAPVCSTLAQVVRCAEHGLTAAQAPVIGAPRNDRLLTADRKETRQRLGWAPEEMVWLWVPTYRESVRGGLRQDTVTSGNGLPFDAVDLAEFGNLLEASGIRVLLKPHPLSDQRLPPGPGLGLLTDADLDRAQATLYTCLAAADGLITDVSSVWVDYLLTERPFVCAFPDLEEYRQRRGFNLEPYEDWMPGPVEKSVRSLAARLAAPETNEARADREALVRRLHRHTDPGSSQRLLDMLGITQQTRASQRP